MPLLSRRYVPSPRCFPVLYSINNVAGGKYWCVFTSMLCASCPAGWQMGRSGLPFLPVTCMPLRCILPSCVFSVSCGRLLRPLCKIFLALCQTRSSLRSRHCPRATCTFRSYKVNGRGVSDAGAFSSECEDMSRCPRRCPRLDPCSANRFLVVESIAEPRLLTGCARTDAGLF
jgi:hypothetical protein